MRLGQRLVEGLLGLLQTLFLLRFLLLERVPLALQRHAIMVHLLPAVERHRMGIFRVLHRRKGVEQRLEQHELLLNLQTLFLLLLPALGIRFTGSQPAVRFVGLRKGKAEASERLGKQSGTLRQFILLLGILGA